MISKKFMGSTISILLGWWYLASPGIQGTSMSIGNPGVMLILGGVLHKVRKHQKFGASKFLMIIEIPILVLFLTTTLIGVLRGYWYDYPLTWCFIPLVIIILYISLFITKKQKNLAKRE